MFDYVLDASVVVQWYTANEELHVREAGRLRDKYLSLGMRKLVVPDLVILELVNALVKGKGAGVVEVAGLIADFYKLGIRIADVDGQVVMMALELMKDNEMTIYDAIYLATAKVYDCKLISDDTKTHGMIKNGNVVMLADWDKMGLP